jgi:predicted nucleic acid-binding protein
MIVVDASVLVAADDVDDPHNRGARAVLEGSDLLATIDLCAWEVANAAIRGRRDPDASVRLLQRVWVIERMEGLVRLDDELLRDACAVAGAHGITVYDAAYVAAARRLGARLVSCDVRGLVRRGLAELPAP